MKSLDPLRPGIAYMRNKGYYHIRIRDPKTGERLFVGNAHTLAEAQRKWDAAKLKLEMPEKHG